jgi:hypothetical protein
MTTATLKIDCTLTPEHFEDIADTAGLVIGYWASSGSIELVDEDGDEIIYRIKEIDGGEYVLTRSDVEAALRDIIEGNVEVGASIREAVTAFAWDKDQGDLDVSQADAIIQVACFQEVVYG